MTSCGSRSRPRAEISCFRYTVWGDVLGCGSKSRTLIYLGQFLRMSKKDQNTIPVAQTTNSPDSLIRSNAYIPVIPANVAVIVITAELENMSCKLVSSSSWEFYS